MKSWSRYYFFSKHKCLSEDLLTNITLNCETQDYTFFDKFFDIFFPDFFSTTLFFAVFYYLGQGIQVWTKQNLWRTAFKNFTWSTLEYLDPFEIKGIVKNSFSYIGRSIHFFQNKMG